MRFRNTLILGLLCAALGAYVYLVEFEQAAQDAKKKTLLDIPADEITEVVLAYPDRELAVTKSGETWGLSKPLQAAADQTSVKNLVRAIAECELKKTLDDVPTDLTPFGLDKPAVTITVKTGGKTLPTIKVGKNTPIGYNTYLQLEGNPKIFLTGSSFESGMKKEPKDLREKQILDVSDAVTRVSLAGGGTEVVLAKTGDQWKIEQPAPYAADAAAVRNLISSVRSMRAIDFPPEDAPPATYGLDQPRLTMTLSEEPKSEQKRILVGKENDKKESYLKIGDRPTVFTVSEWAVKSVNKTVNDLRDKTVLAFDPKAVHEITLQREGETIQLVRTDEKWTIAGNDAVPDQAVVDRLLDDLEELAGQDIASDDPSQFDSFGLGSPKLTITLGGDAAPLGTLKFGSYAGTEGRTEYAVARVGQTTAFKLRENIFTRLDKKLAEFLPEPTPVAAPST